MSGREMTDAASVGMGEHRSAWVTDPTPAPQHPHTTQESREAAQIPLGDLILAAITAAYHQGATIARPSSSAEAMRTATTNAMRASDDMWKAFAEVTVEAGSEPGRCRCGLAGCSDAGVRR